MTPSELVADHWEKRAHLEKEALKLPGEDYLRRKGFKEEDIAAARGGAIGSREQRRSEERATQEMKRSRRTKKEAHVVQVYGEALEKQALTSRQRAALGGAVGGAMPFGTFAGAGGAALGAKKEEHRMGAGLGGGAGAFVGRRVGAIPGWAAVIPVAAIKDPEAAAAAGLGATALRMAGRGVGGAIGGGLGAYAGHGAEASEKKPKKNSEKKASVADQVVELYAQAAENLEKDANLGALGRAGRAVGLQVAKAGKAVQKSGLGGEAGSSIGKGIRRAGHWIGKNPGTAAAIGGTGVAAGTTGLAAGLLARRRD